MANDVLVEALMKREKDYAAAIDSLRAVVENDPKAWDATTLLREAIEMVRCLRRIVPVCAVGDIHRSFGAPGDFGYETPLGDALNRLYRGDR
jgi:hypothetical protein